MILLCFRTRSVIQCANTYTCTSLRSEFEDDLTIGCWTIGWAVLRLVVVKKIEIFPPRWSRSKLATAGTKAVKGPLRLCGKSDPAGRSDQGSAVVPEKDGGVSPPPDKGAWGAGALGVADDVRRNVSQIVPTCPDFICRGDDSRQTF